MAEHADVIIVGGGLAGLVAAAELGDAGKRVILLEQEGENSLGGQAFWSLGGLFLVDSPEQRRMRIRDSRELALQDWLGSAQFDRLEDAWPRKVARSDDFFRSQILIVRSSPPLASTSWHCRHTCTGRGSRMSTPHSGHRASGTLMSPPGS